MFISACLFDFFMIKRPVVCQTYSQSFFLYFLSLFLLVSCFEHPLFLYKISGYKQDSINNYVNYCCYARCGGTQPGYDKRCECCGEQGARDADTVIGKKILPIFSPLSENPELIQMKIQNVKLKSL